MSLADVFEDRAELIPHRTRLFDLIDQCQNLDWLLLTKRPENIREMWPGGYRANVWRGTSVENQTVIHRVTDLLQTNDLSPVTFLSCEPLLFPVTLPEEFLCPDFADDDPRCTQRWVICGGESGSNAREMNVQWAIDLRKQCDDFGVAFFMKQLGGHPDKRGELSDFPEELRVREFPVVPAAVRR